MKINNVTSGFKSSIISVDEHLSVEKSCFTEVSEIFIFLNLKFIISLTF